ncbi:MAG: transcriptional antiterminator, Rof [Chromatiales bacterium]|nr:transcriptional antiterminator, Rof [Chromatiales bacterium]
MKRPYEPISCALYSEYELAILRAQTLRVSWVDGCGVSHVETLQPENLRTRAQQEFMIAKKADGRRHVLRLDRIRHAEIIESGTRLV